MKERIGVYICHCGGNISDHVDVNEVRESVKNEPGVHLAKDTMFACADSTQKEIIRDIQENGHDAMVIASCSPKLHLHTFRNVAERAGLNPYNYVQCNIREQCSWTHTDKPKEATAKAIGLVRAAIARVRNSEALEPITMETEKSVLIVGAGVSGMRAAISLCDMGTQVYLIEKEHFVGGRIVQMGELFTSDERGEDIIAHFYREIMKRDGITLFTGATLDGISGSVGNFTARVAIEPRYIGPDCEEKELQRVMAELDAEIEDEFNFHITRRKAIFKPYETACPDKYVLDKKRWVSDPQFIEKYSNCIDLDQEIETLQLHVGAVILSTGHDYYEPAADEFGYKRYPNVITLPQLKRHIALNGDRLVINDRPIRDVVFIYCVGSRQVDGENKYCSRYCCTAALHTSVSMRKKFGEFHIYHLYNDMRTYGKQELFFEEALEKGCRFIKFGLDDLPVVTAEGQKLIVTVKDLLLAGEELEVPVDLVVLVTGMVPRNDSGKISEILKTPVGTDKFFFEVHPKLRPVETVIDGTFICGTCQGPKNVPESVNSSLSAAIKSSALIGSGKLELEPNVIRINPETCRWCGECAEICPFDCIRPVEDEVRQAKIAAVNKATCKGCGMCAVVCPENAIDIVGYTDEQIESMIDGFILQESV